MNTYDLVFHDRDGLLDSILSFNDRDMALESFGLFDEPDSFEIYSRISLWEYSYETGDYTLIRMMTFSSPA